MVLWLRREEIMTYIETCFFTFYANLDTMKRLTQDKKCLMSVKASSYANHPQNGFGFPVENVVFRRFALETQIKKIKQKVIPVIQLCVYLKFSDVNVKKYDRLYEILLHYYLMSDPIEKVMERLHISRTTFWRKRKKLLEISKNFF